MMRWAGLLRAVNVGGRKLTMADLKAIVEAQGFADARTLLASGNVAFTADSEGAAEIEQRLEEAIERAVGFRSEMFVRNRAELEAVMAANPFPEVARDRPSQLLVLFCRDPVPAEALARLVEGYDGPERLRAVGRELFIDYVEGIGRSNLGPAMARAKFPVLGTGRNWNTVGKLAAMLSE